MAFLAEAELSRGLGTAPHAEQGRSRLAQGHRSDLGGGTDMGEGGRHMGSGRRRGSMSPEWGGRGRADERERGGLGWARGFSGALQVPTLPAPLMHQGQGALVASASPESPRVPALPPCIISHKAKSQPPYPALCFLDLSEMPSRAMSLLKTIIPMSIFTWGSSEGGRQDHQVPSWQGNPHVSPGRETPPRAGVQGEGRAPTATPFPGC